MLNAITVHKVQISKQNSGYTITVFCCEEHQSQIITPLEGMGAKQNPKSSNYYLNFGF
jgi:hypothetical protein